MIAATAFADKRVALFGLGGSGLVTARALLAGGAELVAFDDNPDSVAKAAAEGIPTADLRSIAWAEVAALVLSPGVPLTHPRPHWSVDLAKAADVAIIGDIEIFCRARKEANPSAPFIAITGTNGKSTTTALIAHILAASGLDVQMGGNIGRAVLSLEPPAEYRVHVVECSSYQIDLAPSLNPSVGILLNLTPDHLDRHGSMDAYAAIKERLVAGADHAVVGIDDEHCRAIADRIEAAGRPLTRISRQGTGGFDLSNHRVLRGAHNAQNAAAAIAACRSIGLDDDAIGHGLASFPGLKHRMQPVARRGKAIFVNDSKATNAEAAAPALASFDAIHWIAGGLPKSGGIASLSPLFGRIAKAYLIGEAAPSFAATLGDAVPFEISGTLERAVVHAAADAAQNASPEPAVLLSPACASFDQYRNFEMRGDAFVKAVAAIDGIEMLVPQPCGSE